MLNLDTHILIFALTDDLTAHEKRVLAKNDWGVSAIVMWELAKLVQLERIDLALHSGEVRQVLSKLTVWPLDLAVAIKSTELDFHSDPADEIIAATSMVYDVPLLTRDVKIRKSKLLRFA